jgi:hypothetical protein
MLNLPNLKQLLQEKKTKIKKDDYLKIPYSIRESTLWKEICDALYNEEFYWSINHSQTLNKNAECWQRIIGFNKEFNKVSVFISPGVIEINIGDTDHEPIETHTLLYDCKESFIQKYSSLIQYLEYSVDYFDDY